MARVAEKTPVDVSTVEAKIAGSSASVGGGRSLLLHGLVATKPVVPAAGGD